MGQVLVVANSTIEFMLYVDLRCIGGDSAMQSFCNTVRFLPDSFERSGATVSVLQTFA